MEYTKATLQLFMAINSQLLKINECKLSNTEHVSQDHRSSAVKFTVAKSARKILSFDDLPKNMQMKFRRAGLRGARRSVEEAKNLYSKLPSQVKTSVNDIKAFLSDKQASHITSHSVDRTKSADNIKWENGKDNTMRGSESMTVEEQRKIDVSNARQGALTGLKKCITNGGIAFGVGFLVEGGKTLLDRGIAAAKNKDKFDTDTVKVILEDGLGGAAIAGGCAIVVTAACITFPPLGAGLTALASPLSMYGTGKILKDFGSILNKHYGYRRGRLQSEDNIFDLFSFIPSQLKIENLKVEDYRLEFDYTDKIMLHVLATVEIFASVKAITGDIDCAFCYMETEEFVKVHSSIIDSCNGFDAALIIKWMWDNHKLLLQQSQLSGSCIVSQQIPRCRGICL
ncbi:hypothetical protein MP228_008846 [Amoeboaphelidium protococcarum]|nr:hypothetical protein MP228_008846 [Amoeboaphelidium protococcarum]